MSIFYHEEAPPDSFKRCKFLSATLKDAFSNCHSFGGRRSTSSLEDESTTSDFDEDQEEVVSAIRSQAMEKLRRKPGLLTESFSLVVYSPVTRELYMTPKAVQRGEDLDDEDEDEDFVTVGSCFSCCSSALSREAYHSVKTNFSRSSSLNGLDFQEFWKRSIIQELCHCQGWPFGLCRKAVLLPPLPKSPSESWSWRKGARITKS
ncbi:uncharacterized protein LOC132184938 [Corylus avellana]|uniref:uncharacterized protein LOC132184938 n=1 Tax=Corylus avellana TaxID=13451 RepID=UPI001E21AD1D|nr:uncharacterized protein LOC132184938 [Corylus avellana]